MKSFKDVLLRKTSTIREALLVIDEGALQIALILDDDGVLIGTLTDGDIRRGLLTGMELNDSIEPIIFKNPVVCTIEDSRETILEIASKHKIYLIPILDKLGKLIGLEEISKLQKPQIKSNKVVLMVGGLGTRLRPLTEHTPKPMLKVGNKPILETIILNFKKYGFINIILSVSYMAEVIEEYFGDGSEFGVNIEYVHEDKRMGTAGSLSLLRGKLDESFFVMNGDLLTNVNFSHMMDYHLHKESIATMGIREYDFQVPYGVVNVENEDILSIQEKPIHKFFVSAGIYVLSDKVLEMIPDDAFYDMPTLFEEIIKKELKTVSFAIREYWLDIGRMEEFKKANIEYDKVF